MDDIRYAPKNWLYPDAGDDIPVRMIDNTDGTWSELISVSSFGTTNDVKKIDPNDPATLIELIKGLLQIQLDCKQLLQDIKDLQPPLV